jgi:glycosyltransferase involved in cell wall biosynthesis
MKTHPLVSIVTPTYNQAEYLAATIESVLAQDYPNLEYIVLDDGSTDETPEVLKHYDGRIRHERHENMGQANTLNRGWGMATGTLIGYLSSDDLLESNAVSKLVETLLANPDASVAYCDFTLIDAQGRRFRTVHTEDFDAARLCEDLVCQPGPGALFRREVFEQTGGWAGHLQQIPDFQFWLWASKFGPFVRIPKVLAHYRIHDGSASFRPITVKRSMEIVEVMSEYWIGQTGSQVSRSLATAHMVAAKNHAQSERFTACLTEWKKAICQYPKILRSGSAWRMVTAGMLRRTIHRVRQATTRIKIH